MPADPCTPHTLTASDGAELTVSAHGGHVLGWTPADGQPRLWLSPTAECGPGLAIRGGIPVIFPQFAGRGSLPKHGFARNRRWHVVQSGTHDGAAIWQARLSDSDETRAIWPHRFELTLTARASGNLLETTLTVANTSTEEWEFAAALHSYLALGDPQAAIHGLGGRTAEDNASVGRLTTLGSAGQSLLATQARDVAVLAAQEPLVLDDPAFGRLEITTDGFPDRVVWNPGPRHELGDVPDGDEANFVCIEPAALVSIVVKPATTWTGRQTLRAMTA